MRLAQTGILVFAAAAIIVVALFQTEAAGQQSADAEMVASIRAEELRHSTASDLFYTLTDSLGPRLSGSLSYDKAARWALERFRKWGLANPRLDAGEARNDPSASGQNLVFRFRQLKLEEKFQLLAFS